MPIRLLSVLCLLASVASAQPTLVGPEFQVNTTTGNYVGYEGPDVSADAAGNFVVVWMGPSVFPNAYPNPKGQRFDSAGSPVGGEFAVANFTSGVSTYSRDIGVASDAAGYSNDAADIYGCQLPWTYHRWRGEAGFRTVGQGDVARPSCVHGAGDHRDPDDAVITGEVRLRDDHRRSALLGKSVGIGERKNDDVPLPDGRLRGRHRPCRRLQLPIP